MNQDYICNCCLVTQQEIVDAVLNENATNIDELKEITAATSGCGKCKIMCEHIIKGALTTKK